MSRKPRPRRPKQFGERDASSATPSLAALTDVHPSISGAQPSLRPDGQRSVSSSAADSVVGSAEPNAAGAASTLPDFSESVAVGVTACA